MTDCGEVGPEIWVPELSVVVPLHDEAGNIGSLIREITGALRPETRFEIVCVNDGSRDGTEAVLQAARAEVPELRVLHHDRRSGQSAAVLSGVRLARGDWIATLDGDGQDDPADLPSMIALRDRTANRGPRLIIGRRKTRRDTLAKRWASRAANRIRRAVLDDGACDSGAGLKLLPRALFLEFPAFDHMHRYLPALAISRGAPVLEHPVNNRPRASGRSHYGIIDRGLAGAVDLIGVAWLLHRTKRPLVTEDPG